VEANLTLHLQARGKNERKLMSKKQEGNKNKKEKSTKVDEYEAKKRQKQEENMKRDET